MAKATPARIKYYIDETEQDIRFHSVISEAHQAKSEVTKYPVQTGFQVSNHAIRQNRVIVIEAMISNHLIAGGKTSYQYSVSDNNKTIFKALNDLVNLKIRTKVLTNLGEYNPVVFTSFKTKQEAGLVDSMKLILIGEELQVAEVVNKSAPTPLSWKKVPNQLLPAKKEAIEATGISLGIGAVLEEALVSMGRSFSIGSINNVGDAVKVVYEAVGYDDTTGSHTYAVHTDDIGLFDKVKELGSEALDTVAASVKAGAYPLSKCLFKGAADIAESAALDKVDTAMGKLVQSSYGALYGLTKMSSNDVGQSLIGMSAGCMVRTATDFKDNFPFQPGESLPTPQDMIRGAASIGRKLAGVPDENDAETTKLALLTRVTYPK